MTNVMSGAERHEANNKRQKIERKARLAAACRDLRKMKVKHPISLGMGTQLTNILREKGHGYNAARYAVNQMLNSDYYHKRMLKETHRYNLDGSTSTEITEDEREYARQQMNRHA